MNLNRPITSWRSFNALSDTMQRAYLEHLITEYQPQRNWISDMFGVAPNTIGLKYRALGMKGTGSHGPGYGEKFEARKKKWQLFLDGYFDKSAPAGKKDGQPEGDIEKEDPPQEKQEPVNIFVPQPLGMNLGFDIRDGTWTDLAILVNRVKGIMAENERFNFYLTIHKEETRDEN